MAANRIGFTPFVDDAGNSLSSAFYPSARGDDALAQIANAFTLGFTRYSKSVTLNPPTGFVALPVSAAAAAAGADSFFNYLGFSAVDGDQAVVATTYSGGTLTWATSSGNATGKIASHTGAGDTVFTLNYWRAQTSTWYAFSINVVAGVIASGTAVVSTSAVTNQTIGQPSLTQHNHAATNGIANAQTIGNVSLQRGVAPAKVSNDQTLAQSSAHAKYNATSAAIAQVQTLGNVTLIARAPITYSRSITLSPPSGFTAFPIAAASASQGTNSAFRGLGFTPANNDQAVLPTTYSAGTITWATSSGNATGLISSVTGAGNDVLTIQYWRASNQTWYSLTVTMAGGVVVPANLLSVASVAQTQGISQTPLNGLPLNTTYSRSVTLNPPTGFTAYPISASVALTSSDSVFARLSGPANNDQCVVPTTYPGGNLTWELSGGNMTGRIASHTGTGNATLTIEYWRSVTGTWQTLSVNMVAGVIVTSGPASLASVQALGNVTLSGSSITYSRAIALNPPAGNTAYPIDSNLVTYAVDSIFYGLVGTAVTGDQCVPPVIYDDSGTPRAITWEVVSGCMTGRIAEIDGAAPSSLSIPYWDSTTHTWLTLSITLSARTGLTTASAANVQTLGVVALTQHARIATQNIASVDTISLPAITGSGVAAPRLTVAGIANTNTLSQPSLQARYSLSVNGLAQSNTLSVSGVKRSGGVGVFSVISDQSIQPPTFLQRYQLVALPLYHVQQIGIAGIGFNYSLTVQDTANVQSLSGVSLGVINAHRLDSRQSIQSPLIEAPIAALLYGDIRIYPALTGSLSISG